MQRSWWRQTLVAVSAALALAGGVVAVTAQASAAGSGRPAVSAQAQRDEQTVTQATYGHGSVSVTLTLAPGQVAVLGTFQKARVCVLEGGEQGDVERHAHAPCAGAWVLRSGGRDVLVLGADRFAAAHKGVEVVVVGSWNLVHEHLVVRAAAVEPVPRS